VYLAATTDWSYAEISRLTGLQEKSVRSLVTRYRVDGEAAILTDDRGHMRRHAALTVADEEQLLISLAEDQQTGATIAAAYGYIKFCAESSGMVIRWHWSTTSSSDTDGRVTENPVRQRASFTRRRPLKVCPPQTWLTRSAQAMSPKTSRREGSNQQDIPRDACF
jgi:hypothetical protein